MSIRKSILVASSGLIVTALALFGYVTWGQPPSDSEHLDGFDANVVEPENDAGLHPRLRGLDEWVRPAGPRRVGLQVGHWQTASAPDELSGLRDNTGTSGGGRSEVSVNLEIAEMVKADLEASGIVVDLLPVTIPPNYWADAFIAIHADGNVNSAVNGFKIASPRRDYSGQSDELVTALEHAYASATSLDHDPNISRNMRGYYAFNWRRYDHSIHPITPAAIVETGFLTNSGDRRILLGAPERAAKGITEGIRVWLATLPAV